MKFAARALPIAALALAVAGAARGEVYRWTDAEGRLHFTGSLDQVPAAQREAARRGAEARSAGRGSRAPLLGSRRRRRPARGCRARAATRSRSASRAWDR